MLHGRFKRPIHGRLSVIKISPGFFQDLFSDMIRHYYSQAIKQAYVVIFGLDVIGNPFGLVVGVSRSVEDLFYEPFQVSILTSLMSC
jgi:hypothetical protein